jgi:thioredoxin 1
LHLLTPLGWGQRPGRWNRFADAYREAVSAIRVSVDTHQDLAQKYGITSIPALCLFRAGTRVKLNVGVMAAADLAAWVTEG